MGFSIDLPYGDECQSAWKREDCGDFEGYLSEVEKCFAPLSSNKDSIAKFIMYQPKKEMQKNSFEFFQIP